MSKEIEEKKLGLEEAMLWGIDKIMETDKEHKLIQSYVVDKYFVSTVYRQSSAMVNSPSWYYETMVWEWDKETRKCGKWIHQDGSSSAKNISLICHNEICRRLVMGESLGDRDIEE